MLNTGSHTRQSVPLARIMTKPGQTAHPTNKYSWMCLPLNTTSRK